MDEHTVQPKRAAKRHYSDDSIAQLIDGVVNADEESQIKAASALQASANWSSVEGVQPYLVHEHPHIRHIAIQRLDMMTDARAMHVLFQRLPVEPDSNLRGMILDALFRSPQPEMEPALAAIICSSEPAHVRARAVGLIGHIWERERIRPAPTARASVIDHLIYLLKDPDVEVRAASTFALGYSTDARLGDLADWRAVHPLINTLNDPDTLIRELAVRALRLLRAVQAASALVQRLPVEPDDMVRQGILEALGSTIKPIPPEVLPLLIDEIQKEVDVLNSAADKNARLHAITRIALIGPVAASIAVEPLITVLHDSDNWVRDRAAYALGMMRDARAVQPLIRLVQQHYFNALPGTRHVLAEEALWELARARVPGAREFLEGRGGP